MNDVGIANLKVNAARHHLEEVPGRPDRRRRHRTKLGAGHFGFGHRVVDAVDLNLKMVLIFNAFVAVILRHWAYLDIGLWWNATTVSRCLTSGIPWYHYWSMIKPAKAMTVRLSAEQAEALETVATVEGLAVSEIVRAAISNHIEARKKDPAFRDSLRERIDRAQQLLGE